MGNAVDFIVHISRIMRMPSFRVGVEDYRSGREQFDRFATDGDNPALGYEQGRLFAAIVPVTMKIWRADGAPNPAAIRFFKARGGFGLWATQTSAQRASCE
jgi:hypothetical protein